MTESAKALVAFASALVVALFTAIFAYVRYTREQQHQQRTLLNSLFAELGNILENNTYAAVELPIDSWDWFELKKRLKWATFGPLPSGNAAFWTLLVFFVRRLTRGRVEVAAPESTPVFIEPSRKQL